VVPEVIALVAPRSVVDVGCGPAGWIAEFREAGISDVIGIDGDWVDRDLLLISPELFRAHDLRQPLSLDRMFDLALCLEVAEHLPAERAGPLVSELTKLAPVVLFSAAIPGQGGNGHINEQWPDYWATMFEKSSYVPLDCLRSRFWSDGQIEWCYRQNMILYARRDYVEAHRQLKATFDRQPRCVLRLVHPEG
jgi:SAM-dependent methyltransferase